MALALPIAGAAKAPAKNRQIVKLVTDCEKPAPRMKRAKMGVVTKMTTFRPAVSLKGLPISGPAAMPMLYMESGRIETSSETLNSDRTSSIAGPYREAANVLTKARSVYAIVLRTRRRREKFLGFAGSSWLDQSLACDMLM